VKFGFDERRLMTMDLAELDYWIGAVLEHNQEVDAAMKAAAKRE